MYAGSGEVVMNFDITTLHKHVFLQSATVSAPCFKCNTWQFRSIVYHEL